MSRKTKDISIIFLAYAGFFVITLFQNHYKIDEWFNHVPTLKNIAADGFNSLNDRDKYLAANTPLPYFISAFPAWLTGLKPDLLYSRFFTTFISLSSILLIYYYFRLLKSEFVLEKTLLIFFLPYFLKPSFTFYIAVYGLFFFILLLLYFDSAQKVNWLFAGGITAAAIMSQQFYLCLIPVMILMIFYEQPYPGYTIINKVLSTALCLLPVLLCVIPLFILWKGLTPHSYSFHQVGLDPSKVPAILIAVGIYAFPFLFNRGIKPGLKEIISVLLIAIVLVVFFYPEREDRGGWGKITGISFHLISTIESFNYIFPFVLKVVLCGVGSVILIVIFKNLIKNGFDSLGFLILCFAAGFIFNVLLAERHLLPLIVGIYIYFLNKFDNKLLLRVWVGIAAAGGTSYYLYYLFIQQSY